MRTSIFVLDDEIEIGHAVRRILSEYNVQISDSVEFARQYLENNQVAILIIDFELNQGITGIEMATELKERYPLMQIILFTGNTQYQIIKKALNSGAISSFMNKPISKDELISLVEQNIKNWEDLNHKLQKAIDAIKQGSVSNINLREFGNQTPLLNILLQESVKVKNKDYPQIIGISLIDTKNDAIIMQEFLQKEMVIHDNFLFLGFIETVYKMGNQLFNKSETSLDMINLNQFTLANMVINNKAYTLFVANYKEHKESLESDLQSLIYTMDDNLKEYSFEMEEPIFERIKPMIEETNKKFEI
ncbi:MAG: response regulator [Candidatus Heimdallarchaeota archaeon]|nr:response regulator [Candidatus Heimdallarchaeota archaeon]